MRMRKSIYCSHKTCPGGSLELLAQSLSRVTDFAGIGKEFHLIILSGRV